MKILCWLVALLCTVQCIDSAAAEATSPRFRVGLVLPLSGSAADYGVAIQNSIELARKDAPELFSTIEFIYEDAAFDPKTAVLALNKLIDQDKVDLSVTWGVAFCKTLAPVAEARKAPLIGICLDPQVGKDRPHVIRFKNPIDDMMRVQAQYLRDHGMKRLGVLISEHPYIREAFEALQKHLAPDQTIQVIGRLNTNEAEIRPYVLKTKMMSGEFDAIGTFVFIGQVAQFYRLAAEVKLDTPTFGTDIFESLSEIRAARGTMENVVFTSIDIKAPFRERYKEIFKNESQLSFGAPAYELAMTIGRLFNTISSPLSAADVLNRFAAVQPQEGVASGPYRYINSPEFGRYFEFPVVTKRIKGEGFEVVK